MLGTVQTVTCVRHYEHGEPEVKWVREVWVPHSDSPEFASRYSGTYVHPFKYTVQVVRAAHRKPKSVPRWTD